MDINSRLSQTKQIYSTDELQTLGFSYYHIKKMVQNNLLARLNKSFYENLTFKGDSNDFYFIPAFVPDGIICLMSAAVYYNLSTYRPDSIDVAVPSKKKLTTQPEFFDLSLHYISEDKLNIGVNQITEEDNSFKIYDIEKTVADVICARNKIGIEEAKEVLVNYLSLPKTNINTLYRYAEKLKCLKTLKSYLEVLL